VHKQIKDYFGIVEGVVYQWFIDTNGVSEFKGTYDEAIAECKGINDSCVFGWCTLALEFMPSDCIYVDRRSTRLITGL